MSRKSAFWTLVLVLVAAACGTAWVAHGPGPLDDLSSEEQEQVRELDRRLQYLAVGDLIEKDDGIFLVRETSNHYGCFLFDKNGKSISWGPSPVMRENWKKIRRVVRKSDPEWRETARKLFSD